MKKTIIVCFLFVSVMLLFPGCGTEKEQPKVQETKEEVKELTSEEIEKARIEEELKEVFKIGEEELKDNLKNPSSYKYMGRVVCGSKEKKDKYYVKIEYNATNDFGGAMDGTFFAIVENGKVTSSWFGDAQADWDVTLILDKDYDRVLF